MGSGVSKSKKTSGNSVSDYVLVEDGSGGVSLEASVSAELNGVPFLPTDPVSKCIDALVQGANNLRSGSRGKTDWEVEPDTANKSAIEKQLAVILGDWSKLGSKSFSEPLLFRQAHQFSSLGGKLDKSWEGFLVERNFAKVFVSVWECVSFRQSYGPRGRFRPKYLLLNMLKDITIFLTRSGKEICSSFADTKAVSLMIEEIRHPLLSDEALAKEQSTFLWDSTKATLMRTLVILANLIRGETQALQPVFQAAGAPDTLQKLATGGHTVPIRARARYILAFLFQDGDMMAMKSKGYVEHVEQLAKIFESTLESEKHFSEQYGFSAYDITDAIIHLSTDDNMKRQLVHSAGILPNLTKMLKEGETEEQTSAATALWSLAFQSDNKDVIKNNTNLMEAVWSLREADNSDISRACSGIMWELGMGSSAFCKGKGHHGKGHQGMGHQGIKDHGTEAKESQDVAVPVAPIVEDDDSPHIMISYQWDVQPKVLQVRDYLKESGYHVWMDVDNIGGSTLESMANAVENAAVVLICFTEKYKLSPSCRSEAEYTYKLNKPVVPLKLEKDYNPDGWLGIIIGTKLYFDITLPNIRNELSKVVKELGARGKLGNESSASNSVTRPTTVQFSDTRVTTTRTAASGWSQDDVTAWLASHNLASMGGPLRGYDGNGLLGMKSMESSAPEFFYKTLREEMGLKTMLEIIRFKNALDELR